MQQLVDNRYRIVRRLGSGGMADVYLAHDDILDRDVALKVLSSQYASDEEFVERFKREAQSAAALAHPNIVSIYDRGETEDGTYYIAMEYLPGGTLKDRILRSGALPPKTAAAVALQIAEALKAAHQRGVIHRDIKPHNILITESGDIKVTDFGIARAASSSTMTRTGAVLGTAHYISPEQAMGEPVGPPSDLYSLGVVLYEMLTGRLPYDADTPIGIAMKHVNGHLRPPREVNPAVPEGLDAITVRLLAKDPEDRYQSADELMEDLERVLRGEDPAAAAPTAGMGRVGREETAPTRVQPAVGRQEKRRRWPAAALLSVVLLALLGLGGYQLLQGQAGGEDAPPKIAVPDLEGMSLEEAQREYGEDFDIVAGERRDGPREAGTILEQDPPPGERLERGSEISVTVASGENEVPAVVDSPAEEARSALSEAGFEVKVEEKESEESQEGLVIEQRPEGGSSAEVGSTVTITVGTGVPTVVVPDIPYGYTAEQSRQVLEQAGLRLGNVGYAPNSQVAEGGIIDQNPPPGTEVEEGSAVDIVLSSGPPQTEVPDVVGLDVNVAVQRLSQAGLGYGLIERQSAQPEGTVLATSPPAGSTVDQGTEVQVVYSVGRPEPRPEPTTAQPPERPDEERGGGENRGGGRKEAQRQPPPENPGERRPPEPRPPDKKEERD
ncbi:MAG: Stk1 family PASTA domain-containing Ser/Thr kinase [Rubrobacter sp.]|nr:Stk1 family PASTA domain-containing Ser/Thr kinase [Rubrobacter sp.]